MTSYRPMFILSSGERAGTQQRFATYKEAYDSAAARFMVWIMPTDYSVDESTDPVNYRRVDGSDQSVSS